MKERISMFVITEQTKFNVLNSIIIGLPFIIICGLIQQYISRTIWIAYALGIIGSLIVAYGIVLFGKNAIGNLFSKGIGWKETRIGGSDDGRH